MQGIEVEIEDDSDENIVIPVDQNQWEDITNRMVDLNIDNDNPGEVEVEDESG